MQILKLNATDSTNLYLKNLMLSETLEDYTTVIANKQLKGRGQMGTAWASQAGKNLTCSVLKKFDTFSIADRFLLNICVSLAICRSLKQLQIPDLRIKWPNDILSGHHKICGILIENILSGRNIEAAIIGIGINVNQVEFKGLPQASSLKGLLGRTLSLEELLQSILESLAHYFSVLSNKPAEALHASYEDLLFRKGKPSTFKNKADEMFMGFIDGVSHDGKLLVILEDNIKQAYDLKEIRLLY